MYKRQEQLHAVLHDLLQQRNEVLNDADLLIGDEDGGVVQNSLDLDVYKRQGAQLVREVATKTNDAAGDGTTTATVLAQAMVTEGMKNVCLLYTSRCV